MKTRQFKVLIFGMEALCFILAILVVNLDEMIDIPHLLFGAPNVPGRLAEAMWESICIGLVGLVVLSVTYLLFRRVEHLESYVVLCAWCRRVKLDEEWVSLERYLDEMHEHKTTHGLCPDCNRAQMNRLERESTSPLPSAAQR